MRKTFPKEVLVMAQRNLKNLSRKDLLELLLVQTERNEKLEKELQET